MTKEQLACNNCGDTEEQYLTKYDEDFWLCDICAKEDD